MPKKKAQTITLVTFIGLVVAVLIITTFIIAGIRGCNLVYATNNHRALQGIIDAAQSVATATGTSQGDILTYELKLDSDSAIIGMNPKKPFHYENKNTHISVKSLYYMDFPAECDDTKACLCLCKGIKPQTESNSDYSGDGAYVSCSDLTCKSVDFSISKKILMSSVFDQPKDSKVLVGEGYWDNSFILLRSSLVIPNQIIEEIQDVTTADADTSLKDNTAPIDKTNVGKTVDAPLDVAGYRVFEITDEKVPVKILKDADGGITICLKKDCISKTN